MKDGLKFSRYLRSDEMVDWSEFDKLAKASEFGPPPLSSVDKALIEYMEWPPTLMDKLGTLVTKLLKKES